MTRFHLLNIEIGPSTTSLLDIAWDYSRFSFDFFTVYTVRYDVVHGFSETTHWRLFGFDYYSKLASFCTVRADIYLCGRQFAWKRKAEEVPEDLPF